MYKLSTLKSASKLNEAWAVKGNRIKTTNFHKEHFFSRMPVIVLEGYDSMPIVKTEGYDKMAVNLLNP